jgi:putative membrane protein
MEVDLGRLAEQNASDANVKQFGARMVKDHTKLNSELGAVAKSIGLTVPTALSTEQQTDYAKLSRLSGTKFDKAYMDLMVKDHTGDLAAFRKEKEATQNPKLKRAVAKAIPIIQEHLNMAKSDSPSWRLVESKLDALIAFPYLAPSRFLEHSEERRGTPSLYRSTMS